MAPYEAGLPGRGLILMSPGRFGTEPHFRTIPGVSREPPRVADGSLALTWGPKLPKIGNAYLLTRTPRTGGRAVTTADPAGLLDAALLARIEPPFAAAVPTVEGWRLAQDELGFRSLYRREHPRWAAVSTSALALALIEPAGLDESAVAVLSLLGWPVGDATPWRGIHSLRHGGMLADGAVLTADLPETTGTDDLVGDPVSKAAQILRDTMTAFLDECPDAVLQLTGGIDSRVLLAAIPRKRRGEVSTMTLRTSGSQDATIAADLAARYGMRHVVRDFSGIGALSPEGAFRVCMDAARQLDGAADPIAAAAVATADGDRGPQARIVGLGGEVTRGFYYVGPLWADGVDDARIRRFSDWRLFANEAAPREMFTSGFATWSVQEARRCVRAAFLQSSGGWFERTDAFYLGQRMRRWAGGLASANCLEREDFNPMLDPRFLRLVTQLRPSEKANLRFLARLLDRLDPELADLLMDGRPAPRSYLDQSLAGRANRAVMVGSKVTRKVRQRLMSTKRPSQGSELLAAKVSAHLQSAPELLDPVVATGIIDRIWIERLAAGEVEPQASAVALLVTLLVATTA